MSGPLVSVVTPVHNTELYLAECIESVLGQTYRDFEYVILDNASTDHSLAIARHYAERDARVRVIAESELLPQIPNYNRALTHVSPDAKYVKIVQADDWLFRRCLEEMVAVAETHPSVGVVGAYMLLQDIVYLSEIAWPSTFVPGRDMCRNFLLRGQYVFGSPTATLVRADLVRRRQPFYDETSPVEDVDVCLELLQQADWGFVHQVLTFTRRDNVSTISSLRTFDLMLLTERMAIDRFGPGLLNDDEYRARRRALISRYHLAIGEAWLRRYPRGYWELHRRGLARAGQRLGWGEVAWSVLLTGLTLALNPLSTFQRIWRGLRRR